MTNFTYTPKNIKHLDEPLQQASGTVAVDADNGPYPELTPLMLDSENNNLKMWDGSAGTAVVLNINEVDNDEAEVSNVPLYKSGALKATALNWPDDVTDAQKKVAFIGSPISVFV